MVNVPAAERAPRTATVRRWPPVTLHSGWPYGLAAASLVVVPTAYLFAGPVATPIAFILVGGVLALFRRELRRLASDAPATRVSTPLGVHDDIAVGAGRPTALAAAAIGLVATNALVACGYGALAVVVGTIGFTGPPWWSVAAGAWLVVAAVGLRRAGRLEVHGRWALPALDLAVVIGLIAILLLTADTAPLAAPGRMVPAEATALVVAVLGLCGFGASVASRHARRRPGAAAPGPAGCARAPPRPANGRRAGRPVAGRRGVVGRWCPLARPIARARGRPDRALVRRPRSRGAGRPGGRRRLCHRTAGRSAGRAPGRLRPPVRAGPPAPAPAGPGPHRAAYRRPRLASVGQSVLTGLVIAVTASLGRDPYRDLFVAVGLIGALGLLVLVTVTVWVSLVHAVRCRTLGVVTVLAAVTATMVLAAAAAGSVLTFGVGTPYGLVLHTIYPVAALVGLVWAAVLRRRPPEPRQDPQDHEVAVAESRRS